MNPLRFAKMCKQRKNAALEAYDKAEKMTMDKLKDQLRIRGLDITGSKLDLVERVKAALKRQADTIGFGELSAFGADIVKRIYSSFCKTDGNSKGMSLWDMNRFLDSMSVNTLYNVEEFNHMLKQHSLLTNDGNLSEEGLIAYYERYGHLAQDIEALGYGSLNDLISGDVDISVEYDTDGFVTLLDLMEKHSLRNPFLKYIVCILSSIGMIGVELINDNLSDFIVKMIEQLLPSDTAIPPSSFSSKEFLSYLKRLCSAPGLISRTINAFVEYLSDGDDGVIRDLRLLVLKEFGKFDDWEEIFNESFPKSLAGITKNTGVSDISGDQTLSEDLLIKIKTILPTLLESKINNETNRKSLQDKIKQVDEIIQKSDVLHLKVFEIEALKRYRSKVLDQEEYMSKIIKERQKLALVHFIACYDAFRMYAVGIGSVGVGTKEFMVRINCSGFNFTDLLPKALGEPCLMKERQQEKYNRSIARKETVLNALANEKRKTTTDPIELEKIKKLKEEELRKKRDEEENKLLNDALRCMLDARDERKSIEDLNKMLVLWERLSIAKNNKYGSNHIVSIICQNNLACVYFEFLGLSAKSNEIISAMAGCADSIMLLLGSYHVPFLSQVPNVALSHFAEVSYHKNNSNDDGSSAVSSLPPLELEIIAPCVTILQNFISIIKIRYTANLHEVLHKQHDKLVAIYELFHKLDEKEQKLVSIGKCRMVEHIPVLVTDNFKNQLEITLNDVKSDQDKNSNEVDVTDANNFATDCDFSVNGDGSIGQISQLSPGSLSIDSDMKSDQKFNSPNNFELTMLSDDIQNDNMLDTARLKQLKYSKQKEEDKKLRSIVTRERNKLYSLILSDKISEIFAETAAGAVPAGKNIKWGAGTLSGTSVSTSSDPFAFLDGNDSNHYFQGSSIDQTSTISFENSLENSSLAQSYNTIKGKQDSINNLTQKKIRVKGSTLDSTNDNDNDNNNNLSMSNTRNNIAETNPKKMSYKDKKVLPPKTMFEWIKDKLDL